MHSAAEALQTFRAERDKVNTNRLLSDVEKRQKINEIIKRENGVILRAMGVYNRAKKNELN